MCTIACAPESTGPDYNQPFDLSVDVSGALTAVVGDTLTLTAFVRTMLGAAANNAVVKFEPMANSGHTFEAELRTNAAGIATTRWVLSTVAQQQTVMVTVGDIVTQVMHTPVADDAAWVELADTAYRFNALGETKVIWGFRARDRFGNEIDVPRLNWFVRDTSVANGGASVAMNVMLSARNNGETWLIGMGPVGGIDSIRVHVRQILANIGVASDSEGPMVMGQTRNYRVIGGDGYWNPMPVPSVTWSTTDSLVATIDASGRLTARAVGITSVVAESGELRAVQQLFVDN